MKKILTLFLSICLFTFSLIGCSKQEQDTIEIATKPMSEQFILSEMLKILIEENTELKVNITKGIGGGTSNIHPALLEGDFDMYPEYTSTSWLFVLQNKSIKDKDVLFDELVSEYNEKFNLSWCGMYGFDNTFGLCVSSDVSDKYNIKTYSDLSKYASELTFGAEYDFFERDDGYDALCDAYDLNFKETKDIDIGLKYNAINSNEIDVMNIFTTDGQLSVSDVVVLEDDKMFYETYYCGTVVRNDVLEKYPKLKDTLMLMDSILTESEMAHLNYLLEGENISEEVIAHDFLEEKGLIN